MKKIERVKKAKSWIRGKLSNKLSKKKITLFVSVGIIYYGRYGKYRRILSNVEFYKLSYSRLKRLTIIGFKIIIIIFDDLVKRITLPIGYPFITEIDDMLT